MFLQFVTLGVISVALNTSADIAVAFVGGALGGRLKRSTCLIRRQGVVSGLAMIGLGVYVATAGDAKEDKWPVFLGGPWTAGRGHHGHSGSLH